MAHHLLLTRQISAFFHNNYRTNITTFSLIFNIIVWVLFLFNLRLSILSEILLLLCGCICIRPALKHYNRWRQLFFAQTLEDRLLFADNAQIFALFCNIKHKGYTNEFVVLSVTWLNHLIYFSRF